MKTIIFLFLMPLSAWASPQGVVSETNKQVGVTSTQILAANGDRGYLIVQNNGSSNCQIKFGSAISANEGLIIQTGQNYEPDSSFIKAAVYMKCSIPNQPIEIVESNF